MRSPFPLSPKFLSYHGPLTTKLKRLGPRFVVFPFEFVRLPRHVVTKEEHRFDVSARAFDTKQIAVCSAIGSEDLGAQRCRLLCVYSIKNLCDFRLGSIPKLGSDIWVSLRDVNEQSFSQEERCQESLTYVIKDNISTHLLDKIEVSWRARGNNPPARPDAVNTEAFNTRANSAAELTTWQIVWQSFQLPCFLRRRTTFAVLQPCLQPCLAMAVPEYGKVQIQWLSPRPQQSKLPRNPPAPAQATASLPSRQCTERMLLSRD